MQQRRQLRQLVECRLPRDLAGEPPGVDAEARLVRRSANPNDGRSILAEITDPGRRLVEQCTDRLNAEVFAVVPIPVAQQERAFKALKGVRRAFGDFA